MDIRGFVSRIIIPTLALSLVLATGCDGSSTSGAHELGTGTQTLVVTVEISATENTDNASSPDEFSTTFTATVTKSGTPVDGATVEITPEGGTKITLTSSGSGTYAGSTTGYARTYTLDVTSGSDNVMGAKVEGPAIHTFTSPNDTDAVPPGETLVVRWSPSGADKAELESNNMNRTTVPDIGTATIDGANIVGRNDRQENDRLTLRRENTIEPAGGAAGSTFTVRVRNRIEFLIDQIP